ncbi:4-hydroxy-tetrahydrodipicolinate reductase [Leucobacter chromiiresistens]|uniref:4-hydroxy-tetrahydrodipicolinate reductase n=1 Tax=Leucobacter chromiiresistens TaxID=1079994 RepID=A0A147ER85_9MICO|nr:4-hydroxy-tetrahydrodipicolinate reductase [Leucobacter chromiiresistens]KTR86760.1 dihydrodipicolinate reductase [Leucobacter chromiiresistens]
MTNRVAVSGSTGRLGALVCEVVEQHPDFELVARLRSTSGPEEGADADIVIDVSRPDASPGIVDRALARGQQVVVGTSGWSAALLAELAAKLERTPERGVIVVPNFSLGSVLGTALARIAAPYFDAVEVVEAHHPGKVDSPSGTAVRTAELMAEARGGRPVEAPFADQPARGELVAGIPVHSLRLAGVVAKQEVRFGGPGEVLTLTHDTHSNEAYRAGVRAALEAAPGARGLTVGLDALLGLHGAALDGGAR